MKTRCETMPAGIWEIRGPGSEAGADPLKAGQSYLGRTQPRRWLGICEAGMATRDVRRDDRRRDHEPMQLADRGRR